MKNRKAVIYFVVLVSAAIIIGIYSNTVTKNKLRNSISVEGVVTEFTPCNYSFCLSYEYKIDGKTYNNFVNTEFFRCEDGTKGCVGKTFPVKYSIEDHNVSEIDLGKYNKYKLKKPTL